MFPGVQNATNCRDLPMLIPQKNPATSFSLILPLHPVPIRPWHIRWDGLWFASCSPRQSQSRIRSWPPPGISMGKIWEDIGNYIAIDPWPGKQPHPNHRQSAGTNPNHRVSFRESSRESWWDSSQDTNGKMSGNSGMTETSVKPENPVASANCLRSIAKHLKLRDNLAPAFCTRVKMTWPQVCFLSVEPWKRVGLQLPRLASVPCCFFFDIHRPSTNRFNKFGWFF